MTRFFTLTVVLTVFFPVFTTIPASAQDQTTQPVAQFLVNPGSETNIQAWGTLEAQQWSSTLMTSYAPDGFGVHFDWTTHFAGFRLGTVPSVGTFNLSPFVGLQHTRLSSDYAGFYDFNENFLAPANPQTTASVGFTIGTPFAEPMRQRYDKFTSVTLGTRWLISDDVSSSISRQPGLDAIFAYAGIGRNYWVGRAFDPAHPDRAPIMRLAGFQLSGGAEFPQRGQCGLPTPILLWDDCAVNMVRSGDFLGYIIPHRSPTRSGLNLKLGGGVGYWGATIGPSNGVAHTTHINELRPYLASFLTYTPFGGRWSATFGPRYYFPGNTERPGYFSFQFYLINRVSSL